MWELETVQLPSPEMLKSTNGPVRSLRFDSELIGRKPTLAKIFSDVVTVHSHSIALRQKLVLRLLKQDVSPASRILLLLETNIEKQKIFEAVIKEYAEDEFREVYKTIKPSIEAVDSIRNHFVHWLWGEVEFLKGKKIILAPPKTFHSARIEETIFLLDIRNDPWGVQDKRAAQQIYKQIPDLTDIEIWTEKDFNAAKFSVAACVNTINALIDCIPPYAPYINSSIAERKDVLDLIRKNKLLGTSANAFFGGRFGMHQ